MNKQLGYQNLTEQEKLSQIFFDNEVLIKSVIFKKIADRQQANDIFQDFFLSFVSSPPKNQDNIPSYIRTRLNRDIIDHARKNIRYMNLIDRYSKGTPIDLFSRETPDFKLIAVEERENMFSFLSDNLKQSEAKAVGLRHVDDYDTTETAEIMNIKKRSASRYVSVGIKKLKKILEFKPSETMLKS